MHQTVDWYVQNYHGGDESLLEAELCWRRASDAGCADAQYNLGGLLLERADAASSFEAELWWRRAGQAGHVDAQYDLGGLLYRKAAVDSEAEAEQLWRKAADGGHLVIRV